MVCTQCVFRAVGSCRVVCPAEAESPRPPVRVWWSSKGPSADGSEVNGFKVVSLPQMVQPQPQPQPTSAQVWVQPFQLFDIDDDTANVS